jgi:transposase
MKRIQVPPLTEEQLAETVTEEYRKRMLADFQRRPRSLGLEYSMWALHRLTNYLAEETGIRISHETVRRELAKEGVVFMELSLHFFCACT